MPTTMDKNILLNTPPIAWVFELDETNDAIIDLWSFDNLQSATVKYLMGGATAAGVEYVEITRADGVILKAPKETASLLISDETAVPTATGSEASGFGEMTLVLNEANTTATSWTGFVKSIIDNKDKKLLVVLPSGYSIARMGTGTSRKPDGFYYMIGKISNDIEQTLDANPKTITLTFASQTAAGWAPATDVSFTGKGIAIKRGGGSNDIPATNNVPLSITVATDLAILQAGKILVKANA